MQFTQTPCVVVGNLDIVRPLAMAGLPVVLATSRTNRAAFSSRFCQVVHEVPSPTRQPDAFVDRLIDIGRGLQPWNPVLFYSGDTDLIAISGRRDELLPYYRFNMASRELVDQLTDKIGFVELARKLELPTPETCIYHAGSRNALAANSLHYPCIVKPATRGAWLGSEVIRRLNKPYKALQVADAGALEALLPLLDKSADTFVIQELVAGGEDNIVSYHSYVNGEGVILGEFTGRKIRTFPLEYGVSSAVIVNDNAAVKHFGRDIIARLGLHGVSKIDIKTDAHSGEMKLLEVNPRFSLWNHPGARAGVNLEHLAYRDILGDTRIPAVRVHREVKWVNFKLDALAYLDARAAGTLTLWPWIRSLRGPKVFTLWARNDPAPFLRHGLKTTLGMLNNITFRSLRKTLKRAIGTRLGIIHERG